MNLDSDQINEVRVFLGEKNPSIDFSFSVVGDGSRLIVTLSSGSIAGRASRTKTSPRQLQVWKSEIDKKLSLRVRFAVFPTPEQEQVEIGLLGMLRLSYGVQKMDVVATFMLDRAVAVWMQESPERALSDADIKDLRSRVAGYLRSCELTLSDFVVEHATMRVANLIDVLKSVKIMQPCRVTEIDAALENCSLRVESETWLGNMVDSLRKKGYLIRSSGGFLSLTAAGLRNVPTSHSRGSSDVERALALARRKW